MTENRAKYALREVRMSKRMRRAWIGLSAAICVFVWPILLLRPECAAETKKTESKKETGATEKGEVSADDRIGKFAELTGERWNLRAEPSLSSEVVLQAYRGAHFKILNVVKDKEGGREWYMVRALNRDLYLSAEKDFKIRSEAPYAETADPGPAEAEFEAELNAFPVSYHAGLRMLHKQHPKWRFQALTLSTDFEAAVDEEASVRARNLIRNSAHYPDAISMMLDLKEEDGGGYVAVSREGIAYFMDPRNFLNEKDVFQFETMRSEGSQRLEGLRALYRGNEDLLQMVDALFQICREENLNPYTMGTRIRTEVSLGDRVTNIARGDIDPFWLPIHAGDTSLSLLSPEEQKKALERYEKQLIFRGSSLPARERALKERLERNPSDGLKAPETRYYNVANIAAYPNVGTPDGAAVNALYFAMGYNTGLSAEEQAYFELPWTSREKAIRGAVKWIRRQYIDEEQDTVYFQKWDVVGENPRFWHQYMGSVLAPQTEGEGQFEAYQKAGLLDEEIRFVIPVYREMPERSVPHPVLLPEPPRPASPETGTKKSSSAAAARTERASGTGSKEA